jgi:hypothetical protein
VLNIPLSDRVILSPDECSIAPYLLYDYHLRARYQPSSMLGKELPIEPSTGRNNGVSVNHAVNVI